MRYDWPLDKEERKECNRELAEAVDSGTSLDFVFVGKFFPVLLKMFPEEQRNPLLRKHIYKTLGKLMKLEEPGQQNNKTKLGLAQEFASYLGTVEVDHSFDPDEDISDIDKKPPLPIGQKWEPVVQIAYKSLLKEGDTDHASEISMKTGIEPEVKFMRKEIQEGFEALLCGGWSLRVMENLTRTKPHKTTVKKSYDFLLFEGRGDDIKRRQGDTGVEPNAEKVDCACRKIFQEANSEGGMFMSLRKLESLEKAGIKPSKDVIEYGYKMCYVGGLVNEARSLKARTKIEPEDPEIKKWIENRD